jgi:hypothetical protein
MLPSSTAFMLRAVARAISTTVFEVPTFEYRERYEPRDKLFPPANVH